ncbi:MAG TPA: Hpt domain-containing protein, partial [Polyangia bacterium]
MEIDRELLEIFVDEARGYVDRLRAPGASTRQRSEAAHGLKGAASMLGLEDLRALALELERRIREKDAGAESALVAQIVAAIAALALGPGPAGGAPSPATGAPP